MKVHRDIIFYTLFGMILLLIGVAAHNLSEINQTIDRWEDLQSNYQAMQTMEVIQIGNE